MAGATVEIQGESNVGDIVSRDLARARGALTDIEKGGGQAAGGMNLLNGAMSAAGALGIGVTAAGLLSAAEAARELGADTLEATSALNAMTSGRADQYIGAITSASDGMITNLDAAQISNRALTQGFITSREQMGQLTNAATVFADVMGTDTVTAENMLIDAIGKGNSRMLAQLGIIEKGKDFTADINALMAQNANLSFTQANQLAAFNAVMEKSNQLQAAGVGQMRSAADSNERFGAAVKNAQTKIGETLAPNVQVMQEWATGVLTGEQKVSALNGGVADLREQIAESSGNFRDYVAALRAAGLETQLGAQGMAKLSQEYQKFRVAGAVQHQWDLYAAHQGAADAATVNQAAVNNLTASIGPLSAAINQYNAEVQQQAGGVLNLLQNQGQLNDAWSMGQAALQQADLSATQTLALYEQLGLATGKLSVAQIEAANVGQQLNNMWVAGTLSTEAYAQAVNSLTAGANANAVAHQAQSNALNTLAANLMAQGVPAMDAYARAQQQVKASADGTTQSAAELETMITNYNNALAQMNQPSMIQFQQQGGDQLLTLTNLISAGLTTMPTAHDIAFADNAPAAEARVDKVSAALNRVPREIDVTINVTTNGDIPSGGSAAPTGRAVGGPVFAGAGYIVGERGPEFFMPNVNGTIVPNNQISTISGASGGSAGPSGGGATYVTLNAYGVNDPIQLVQMIDRELTAQGRAFARAT